MPIASHAWPCQGQEPETPSWLSTWVAEAQTLNPLATAPQQVQCRKLGQSVMRTQTQALQ